MTLSSRLATVGAPVSDELVGRDMNSLPQPLTMRWLLAPLLLIAAVVGCVDRDPPSWEELAELSGDGVLDLVGERYYSGSRQICGAMVSPDYEDDGSETRPHGLDGSSTVPAGAVAAVEELGGVVEDHEHRHFDTHRLLLISWDRTSADPDRDYGVDLGSVFELHHEVNVDDGSATWYVVFSGSVFDCPSDWPD